jgi:hypothetical protein
MSCKSGSDGVVILLPYLWPGKPGPCSQHAGKRQVACKDGVVNCRLIFGFGMRSPDSNIKPYVASWIANVQGPNVKLAENGLHMPRESLKHNGMCYPGAFKLSVPDASDSKGRRPYLDEQLRISLNSTKLSQFASSPRGFGYAASHRHC